MSAYDGRSGAVDRGLRSRRRSSEVAGPRRLATFRAISGTFFFFVLGPAYGLAQTSPEPSEAVDWLSLARGVVPVAIGDPSATKVGFDQALLAIDGDAGGFGATPKPGGADTRIDLVYALPAPTTFEAFGVPNVLETPSPSQTFFRRVEIAGASESRDGPFEVLAEATLETHAAAGQVTRFPALVQRPVRWIRLRLEGGIDVRSEKTFFEFSEIEGHGTQEPVPPSESFHGHWKGRGVALELAQEGPRVRGCYDGDGRLEGTVSGNLLHATGESTRSGVASAFVLAVGEEGRITGVRSTNGAPFRLYRGEPDAAPKSRCPEEPVEPLGCGSILHGLHFGFDSARLLPESEPLLELLHEGLRETVGASEGAPVLVVGHTSSEGSDAYNADLSRRRAEAVVEALAARGLDRAWLRAEGRGETRPIADNATEAGRSLNRRVEIECPAPGGA